MGQLTNHHTLIAPRTVPPRLLRAAAGKNASKSQGLQVESEQCLPII
jgi:hypothetical protein